MTRYQYALVKYVHNAASGECVNVGVILFAPEQKRIIVEFNQRYSRISTFFQGAFNGGHYRSMVRHLDREFKSQERKLEGDNGYFGTVRETPNGLEIILRSVLPEDSTTFQWGPVYGGIVEDVEKRFRSLFEEFIIRHETKSVRESREEYQIWSDFEERLSHRALSRAVHPLKIETREYQYEFKGSFTNGKLNVLEPVSFDLIDRKSIIEKANTWVGRLATLGRKTDFMFNGILAPPSFQGRITEFDRAIGILRSQENVKRLIVEGNDQGDTEALLNEIQAASKQRNGKENADR
jgi:hypothetical protein